MLLTFGGGSADHLGGHERTPLNPGSVRATACATGRRAPAAATGLATHRPGYHAEDPIGGAGGGDQHHGILNSHRGLYTILEAIW